MKDSPQHSRVVQERSSFTAAKLY